MLDASAGITLTGQLGDYLETLGSIDFSNFDANRLKNPDNIRQLLQLAGSLGNIGERDTVAATFSMGSAMQIGHFGIGFRTFGQVGGWIQDLDLKNIGLSYGASLIADEFRDAMNSDGFIPSNYTMQYLGSDSVEQLRDAFGGSIVNDDIISYVDYKLAELVNENDIDPDEVQGAVDTLADLVASSGVSGDALTENTTSVVGRGFMAVEIPFSYGYAFNDNFSAGITAKAIFGRVYGTQVWAFNEDNEQILNDSLDSSVDRVSIGLDLAAMYRVPNFQFALTGNNLNRPEFKGYDQQVTVNGQSKNVTVRDVELDPQITLGAAWIPHWRFTLATDYELLETGTLLSHYDVQRLSFGGELDLSLVELRLGTYKNLAEDDIGWVATGGLGVQLWAVSVDLGAAVSIDDAVTFDGHDYPRTFKLYAGIGMDF